MRTPPSHLSTSWLINGSMDIYFMTVVIKRKEISVGIACANNINNEVLQDIR